MCDPPNAQKPAEAAPVTASDMWVVVKEFEPPENTLWSGGSYEVSITVVKAGDSVTAIKIAKTKDTPGDKTAAVRASEAAHACWSAINISDLDDLTVIQFVNWSSAH